VTGAQAGVSERHEWTEVTRVGGRGEEDTHELADGRAPEPIPRGMHPGLATGQSDQGDPRARPDLGEVRVRVDPGKERAMTSALKNLEYRLAAVAAITDPQALLAWQWSTRSPAPVTDPTPSTPTDATS
jgi:hypothetical protein